VGHSNNSSTVRLRYSISSGANLQDGTHAGRVLARLVRTTNTEVRVFNANGSTNDIQSWDLAGTAKETYTGTSLTPAAVAVDPWSQELYMLHAGSSSPITVSVWTLGSLTTPKRTLTISSGSIPADTWNQLAVLQGYLCIGGSSSSGKVVVADARSGAFIANLTLSDTTSGAKYMTISPEGYLFVAVGSKRVIDQWNLWTRTLIRSIDHGAIVASANTSGMAYDPFQRELVVAATTGTVISWIRFAVDTGSWTVTGTKGPTDGHNVGTGLITSATEYWAYDNNSGYITTARRSYASFATVTFTSAVLGSSPYQFAWLY
jgi:WD40 repeat protein